MQYAATAHGGCAALLAVSASPIRKLPAGMSTMPAGHDDTHAPPLQVWPLVHIRPHTPQLAVVVSAMHAPPQRLVPLGHD